MAGVHMNQSQQEIIRRPVRSAMLASLAFVALLLPIVTPTLNPAFVGANPSHGHLVIDGVVGPHSHSITDTESGDIIFTSEDAGSAASALVIISPAQDSVDISGASLLVTFHRDAVSDQWSPGSLERPPRISA